MSEAKQRWIHTIPISPNAPILLMWTSDDDVVHVEAFGQHFDGMAWPDFIQRVGYLQHAHDKYQAEMEARGE